MKNKDVRGKRGALAGLRRNKQGFTIVELLIVVVVIIVLASLVVTTFNGVQQRSRNQDRKRDLEVLKSQLESYHIQHGFYPSLANMNSAKWLKDNMKSLDTDILQPPGSNQKGLAQKSTDDQYGYDVTPVDCNNAEGGQDCTTYVLTAHLEGSDETVEVKALNQ